MAENPNVSQLCCVVAGDTCHTLSWQWKHPSYGTMASLLPMCLCVFVFIFRCLLPNTEKWNKKIRYPNRFSYIMFHIQKVASMQAKENWSNILTGGWSWGRQIWLAIIHYLLPSTKPHQSTKCLPSPCSHFHTSHTRNYKTALHISNMFKKE